MSFKIQDLLIEVLPEKVDVDHTILSPTEWAWCSEIWFCHGCSKVPTSIGLPLADINKGLSGLKRVLKDKLAAGLTTEKIEKDLSPKPDEVNELRQKLRAVLEKLDELSEHP
jgi:hypothetical protein